MTEAIALRPTYRTPNARDYAIHRRWHAHSPWVDDGQGTKCCARCADRLVVTHGRDERPLKIIPFAKLDAHRAIFLSNRRWRHENGWCETHRRRTWLVPVPGEAGKAWRCHGEYDAGGVIIETTGCSSSTRLRSIAPRRNAGA